MHGPVKEFTAGGKECTALCRNSPPGGSSLRGDLCRLALEREAARRFRPHPGCAYQDCVFDRGAG
eukprot:7085006-Pyramimonas_sp.AAC.2